MMIVNWRSRAWTWLASAFVAVSLVSCAGGETDDSRDQSDKGDNPTRTDATRTPRGEAGDPDGPTAKPAANVGAEGALNRPGPDERAWTPQQAADALLAGDLVYSDGTVHDPGFVSCAGVSTPEDNASFETLECTVRAPDVAPYKVVVNVQEGGKAGIEIAGPAK